MSATPASRLGSHATQPHAGGDRFATASPPRPRKSTVFVRPVSPLCAGVSPATDPLSRTSAGVSTSGENRTLRKPHGRSGAETESCVSGAGAVDERLRKTHAYRASCVARSSCSIASRRPRLRSAFFADDSLCGLHNRQPARRCLGRPRLWFAIRRDSRHLSASIRSMQSNRLSRWHRSGSTPRHLA